MTGKFLRHDALVHLIKSQERTNAIQKRDGLTLHAVRTTVCGCSDPSCGGWHTIAKEATIPNEGECLLILKEEKARRRRS